MNGACTKSFQPISYESRPEVKASAVLSDSFKVVREGEVKDTNDKIVLDINQYYVQIAKSALDKEFLLMSSALSQFPTPMFNGLKSKVVAFQKYQERLYMLEATQGHILSGNIAGHIILTSFPIISEDSGSITFDFNVGMSQLFVQSDWFTQDFDGTVFIQNMQSIPVRESFLSEAKISNNQMIIHQVAQVQQNENYSANVNPGQASVEVRYYLTPYNPDRTFLPVQSPGLEKVGFFEASPLLLNDGSSLIYASKHNNKRTITYAISANTPMDVREAVKDGILYWNKVLGDQKIQVIQLEDENITAPNADYNVIQWTNWDQAGFAYADAQMDPRSGQVLHAQVFMSSAFEVGGRAAAIKRLRYLNQNDRSAVKSIQMRGFEKAAPCSLTDGNFRQFLTAAVEGRYDDSLIKKMSLDYVREVVAHEVGHTLGLRHNFAGNLGSSYRFSERAEIYKKYIAERVVDPSVMPTTSLMEYQDYEDAMFSGALLADPKAEIFPYDKMALEYLYKAKKLTDDGPLFCTDSDVGKYFECNRWDSGSNSYESYAQPLTAKKLAQFFMNDFISFKVPESGKSVKISDYDIDLNFLAENLYADKYKLITAFTTDHRMIGVRKLDAAKASFNSKSASELETAAMKKVIAGLGGVDGLFPKIDPNLASEIINEFNLLTENPEILDGFEGEKEYSFSQAEVVQMKNMMATMAPLLQKAFVIQDLKVLNMTSPSDAGASETRILKSDDNSTQLINLLMDRSNDILFAKSSSSIQGDAIMVDGQSVTYTLPQYVYPREARLLAADLFNCAHSEDAVWGYSERAKLLSSIDNEIKLLPVEVEKLSKEKANPVLVRWIYENLKVKAAIEAGN